MMNFSDFIIIYLAVGAPFAVYYFVDNRNKQETKIVWLGAFFTFVFWIPFLVEILKRNDFFGKFLSGDLFKSKLNETSQTEEIFLFQKKFENFFKNGKLKMSIYEFRELLERYIGLSLALNNSNEETKPKEIFQFSTHNNIELANICLNRRNRKHLSFHQINARREFIDIIKELYISDVDRKDLGDTMVEFFRILSDENGLEICENEILSAFPQTKNDLTVNNTEEEKWKTDTHKPLHANNLPIRLRAMHAMETNLLKKD